MFEYSLCGWENCHESVISSSDLLVMSPVYHHSLGKLEVLTSFFLPVLGFWKHPHCSGRKHCQVSAQEGWSPLALGSAQICSHCTVSGWISSCPHGLVALSKFQMGNSGVCTSPVILLGVLTFLTSLFLTYSFLLLPHGSLFFQYVTWLVFLMCCSEASLRPLSFHTLPQQ